jgi:hypothetical protein
MDDVEREGLREIKVSNAVHDWGECRNFFQKNIVNKRICLFVQLLGNLQLTRWKCCVIAMNNDGTK